MGLSGPHSRYGHYGEEKNLLPLLETELRFLGRPSRRLVTIPTKVNKLKYITNVENV